jgi:hypothetical protein
MIDINYGVVQIEGAWTVISAGLRIGPYATEAEAEEVARRMADQAAGLKVDLHLQDELGELRRESRRAED